MKGIIALLVISIIPVVNTTLLSSLMLPPTIEEAKYNQSYTKLVNSNTEYIFVYKRNKNSFLQEARVTVESNATTDFPLIIVVKQKGGILFWQIPLTENLEYGNVSRTLCSLNSDSSEEEPITVSLSTASFFNISFRLIVLPINNFYIRSGEERNDIIISPTEPVYYSYSFDDDLKNKSVVVHLESESEICMILSIQNKSCPVFDLERNIQFSGYWQTVSKQGGITVSREKYPDGFFIVLIVKSDDGDCTDVSGKGPHQVPLLTKVGFLPRIKIVNLTLKPGISTENYVIATLSVTSAVLAFCVFYIFGELLYYKVKGGGHFQEKHSLKHRQENVFNRNIAMPSCPEQAGPRLRNMQNSFLDQNLDSIEDGVTNNKVVQKKFDLCVCDLSCKEPEDLRKKSNLYTYYISTVAVFYTLPVLQLVITDQIVLHISGNQDLCYYNFLCSHPFGFLSDFNHVFSNIVYVLLGLLFLLLIYLREKSNEDVTKNKCYGIPQHYGLFYAMGIALIMEGVLSGSYHVCPSHSNFQFDTSFMYIISVLCIVKIYQNRHSDIYPKASAAFGFLAFVIFMGLVGVLVGSPIFWIGFTIMHLVLSFLLTAKVYYLGKWSLDGRTLLRIYKALKREVRGELKNLLMPLYPTRLSVLIMAYLCNLGLAIFGYIHHANDFSTYLLVILMMNLLLYLFFYIIMKLCYKERILFQPAVYIILSVLSWSGSTYFFLSTTTSWSFTPAQSRIYNRSCIFLNFFDSHDIWHFLSAIAIFFSFMVLLTLDDDLTHVHRNQIPVF